MLTISYLFTRKRAHSIIVHVCLFFSSFSCMLLHATPHTLCSRPLSRRHCHQRLLLLATAGFVECVLWLTLKHFVSVYGVNVKCVLCARRPPFSIMCNASTERLLLLNVPAAVGYYICCGILLTTSARESMLTRFVLWPQKRSLHTHTRMMYILGTGQRKDY